MSHGCCIDLKEKTKMDEYKNSKEWQALNDIWKSLSKEQREGFYEFVKIEYDKMLDCFYDRSTKELPISASEKRGVLNVY